VKRGAIADCADLAIRRLRRNLRRKGNPLPERCRYELAAEEAERAGPADRLFPAVDAEPLIEA
jgi:hypothetical protein